MQEVARVVSIEGKVVTVQPLDIEVCIGCSNSECKKNGNLFKAINTQNFSLFLGSEVKVAAPIKNQFVQALIAIGVPVVMSMASFVFMRNKFISFGEGAAVGVALGVLVFGMILIYFIRQVPDHDLPEVVSVIED